MKKLFLLHFLAAVYLPASCNITCSDDEFACEDGSRCLPGWTFCNGYEQCRDGSDEISPRSVLDGKLCSQNVYICKLPMSQLHKERVFCKKNVTCSDDEFACEDGYKCIRGSWFCDGYESCKDGSDEISPGSALDGKLCRQTWHVCKLPMSQLHKEEVFCKKNSTCSDDEFACEDGSRCLHGSWFCDGFEHCRDGSDEISPGSALEGKLCRRDRYVCKLPASRLHKENFFCKKNPNCTSGEFQCADESECIPMSKFCDGSEDTCGDGSDEIPFQGVIQDGFKMCRVFDKFSGRKRECQVPRNHSCDSCLNDTKNFLDDECFRCLRYPDTIITIDKLCDGFIDCPDLSDECMCKDPAAGEICRRTKWDDESESTVKNVTKILFSCESSEGSLLIEERQICDSRIDCKDGVDENFCSEKLSDTKIYMCLFPRDQKATRCDGIPECDWSYEYEECRTCEDEPGFCGHLRAGLINCLNVVEARYIPLSGDKVCDGDTDCADGSDELHCTNRTHYYCNAIDGTSFIPVQKKCDQILDCIDESDEANCSYRCVTDEPVKFLRPGQVCDGVQDCRIGDDECQTHCIESSFSDIHSMIKHQSVLSCLFIIGLFAVLGNSFTIVTELRKFFFLKKKPPMEGQRNQRRRKKINRILLFNLAIGDLLVGIYVLSICAVSIHTAGSYCLADHAWRSSDACSALGVVLVTGSEQSVLTMLLISISRWHAITKPFNDAPVKAFVIVIVIAWIVSISISVFPLIPSVEDSFVSSIWYENNKLFTSITQNEAKSIVRWLMTIDRNVNESNTNLRYVGLWANLESRIKDLNRNLIVGRKYGFYSSHTVCIPELFPDRENDGSWWYSIMIISLNFFAFVIILLLNIDLYRSANKTGKVGKSERRSKQTSKMQKKLTAVVATDFLCWVPISIMVIMQQSGVVISDDWRLVVGMIFIPINSAVNPIIYSNVPEMIWSKTTEPRTWINNFCLVPFIRALRECFPLIGNSGQVVEGQQAPENPRTSLAAISGEEGCGDAEEIHVDTVL